MVWDEYDRELCLQLALATPTVMSWTLLFFAVDALFLESGYRAIAGRWEGVSSVLSSKKGQHETAGERV